MLGWFLVFCFPSGNRKPLIFENFQTGQKSNYQHEKERKKSSGVALGTFFSRPNNEPRVTKRHFLSIKKRRLVEKGFNSTGSGPSFHIWISGIGSVFDDADDVSYFELMSYCLFCSELLIAYSSSHPHRSAAIPPWFFGPCCQPILSYRE